MWRINAPERAENTATSSTRSAPAQPQDASLSQESERLSPEAKAYFGDRLGHDFSDVRIRSAPPAHHSDGLDVDAYTVGRDITVAPDKLSTETRDGVRLLAHELTHVVQQSRGGTTDFAPGLESQLEAEADRSAAVVADGGTHRVSGSSGLRIACQDGPEVPASLSFLTESQIRKLHGFGDADFQQSINAMLGHVRKTKGFTYRGDTQQYIDIRQASGELATFLDFANDPQVVAIKVVPSAGGGRSPDMYVKYANSTTGTRVEIVNITLASADQRPDAWVNPQGKVRPSISKDENPDQPGTTRVTLPVKDFDHAAIRDAIRAKIQAGTKGPSQLDAQNPNTVAGGAQMDPGGVVVVRITHGKVDKARVDQIIQELEPELVASSAQRVHIDSIDAADPRAGRRVFTYSRSGQKFVGQVRQPNRAPAVQQNPAGPSGAGGSGGPLQTPPAKQAVGRQAAALALQMVMAKLDEIGRSVQDQAARTQVAAARRELLDHLRQRPGIGAVIEVQFLEPEHRFQEIFVRDSDLSDAGTPTKVANTEGRQPVSTFILVAPVEGAKQDGTGPSVGAPLEVRTPGEFEAAFALARGGQPLSAGSLAIEMHEALRLGERTFGYTDVRVGRLTLRVTDAARSAAESAIATKAESATRKRLERLNGRIDAQQVRLDERVAKWFGGSIKLTGHELDPARAHQAAALNYFNDKRFKPACESIEAGERQVEEVYAETYEFDFGHRPLVPLMW